MVLYGMALYGKPDYNWQGMAITSYCIISDGMTHGIYSNSIYSNKMTKNRMKIKYKKYIHKNNGKYTQEIVAYRIIFLSC